MPKQSKKLKSTTGRKARPKRIIILMSAIALLLFLLLLLIPARDSRRRQTETAIEEAPEDREGIRGRPVKPGKGIEEHPVRARLSLVIDDVGYSLRDLEAFLEFPGSLTFAVLPNLPYSAEAARMIVEAERELILHYPMEPVNGEDAGPGVLLTFYSEEEIEKRLAKNLSSMPEAIGINNHMGSRFTAFEEGMRPVMKYLKENGKIFLDSKTTPDSLGSSLAGQAGVPFLERDIFIDYEQSEEYIKKAILKGADIALKRGSAVLIGHVYNRQIIAVLKEIYPDLAERGIQFSSLKDLIAAKGARLDESTGD